MLQIHSSVETISGQQMHELDKNQMKHLLRINWLQGMPMVSIYISLLIINYVLLIVYISTTYDKLLSVYIHICRSVALYSFPESQLLTISQYTIAHKLWDVQLASRKNLSPRRQQVSVCSLSAALFRNDRFLGVAESVHYMCTSRKRKHQSSQAI